MGGKRKDLAEIGGKSEPKQKRTRNLNWKQEDTERLCCLLLTHGKGGILNKITNAATNEIKKAEWNIIVDHFNACPMVCILFLFFVYLLILCFSLSQNECVRDAKSLQTRYKRVMFEMRMLKRWERQNTTRTGGGPPQPKPSEIKIEASGSVLEVFERFGHLMTGRVPFDSDRPDDNENEDPNSEPIAAVVESLPSQLTNTPTIITTTVNDDAIDDAIDDVPDDVVLLPTLPTAIDQRPTPPARKPRQYFATADQRRRPIDKSCTAQNEFWQERVRYIQNEQQQSAELHRMRIKILQEESAMRISVIKLKSEYWKASVAAIKASNDKNTVATTTPVADDLIQYLESDDYEDDDQDYQNSNI